MRDTLEKLLDRQDLTRAEVQAVFAALVQGRLDPIEIAALLTALRAKGEHPEEIAAAAQALRASAEPFPRPDYDFADSVGTGGDGAHTINISTAVALVAAQMGIRVAKHGNRSVSSKCGSADVLQQLGVKIDAAPHVARRCLDELGLCFLFAPQYHPGLRHAMPVRRALGIRTVMNILGPLVNPSAPTHQLVGVYDPRLCAPLAKSYELMGCKAAMVVHGSGLDEIAVHGPTQAVLYRDRKVSHLEITPAQAGLQTYPIETLRGGTPEENAALLRRLLAGEGSDAHCAAVALNAGALGWICGKAEDLRSGVALAMETLRGGRCLSLLERWAAQSHGA